MTFTIEPMINLGSHEVEVLEDDWTAITVDGSLSAQFEHTLLVTETGVEILTQRPGASKTARFSRNTGPADTLRASRRRAAAPLRPRARLAVPPVRGAPARPRAPRSEASFMKQQQRALAAQRARCMPRRTRPVTIRRRTSARCRAVDTPVEALPATAHTARNWLDLPIQRGCGERLDERARAWLASARHALGEQSIR
jgi:hypothetical protein